MQVVLDSVDMLINLLLLLSYILTVAWSRKYTSHVSVKARVDYTMDWTGLDGAESAHQTTRIIQTANVLEATMGCLHLCVKVASYIGC